MNVLSIGNSFSQDAHTYLHQIARRNGDELNAFNLYIGGCPLSLHYRNMLKDDDSYEFFVNGVFSGLKVRMKEVLLCREWDYITIQQVSSDSPNYETYEPYLTRVIDFVRECAPKTKILIHQTWAYEEGSKRLTEELGYTKRADMFSDIEASYKKAADAIKADFIIPAGELMEKLTEAGIEKVHRDTFHAGWGLGRYAIGLLWYAMLMDKDVSEDKFDDLDEPATEEELSIARKCVSEIYKKYKK